MCEKASHLCHPAGPLTAITKPISCFRESEPPACCSWPPTKSQKYENYPSTHGPHFFKSHQRSEARPDWHCTTLPNATADHKNLSPPSPRRNKVTRVILSYLYGCTIPRPRGSGDYSNAPSPDKQRQLPLALLSLSLILAGPDFTPPARLAQCVTSLWGVALRNSLTCCPRVCSPFSFLARL